ncbi:MAG: hypothetical protein H5U40_08555 [Polyangiaceae bacterium]|nr:hypothetical protein [Polyangiaceae bacterium]
MAQPSAIAIGPEPFKPGTFSEFAAVPATRGSSPASSRSNESLAPTPVGFERQIAVAEPPTPPDASSATSRSGARMMFGLILASLLVLTIAGVFVAAYAGGGAWASSPEPPALPATATRSPAEPRAPDIVVGEVPTLPPARPVAAPSASNEATLPEGAPTPDTRAREGTLAPASPRLEPSFPVASTSPAPAADERVISPAAERRARASAAAAEGRRARASATVVEEAVPPPFVYEATTESAAPPPETASGFLRAARERQRAGDPAECVELGRRALALGAGPTAQLLLGDCHLSLGDTEGAGKAYESFCRAMPSHPAVLRVVSVVERTGGRCN